MKHKYISNVVSTVFLGLMLIGYNFLVCFLEDNIYKWDVLCFIAYKAIILLFASYILARIYTVFYHWNTHLSIIITMALYTIGFCFLASPYFLALLFHPITSNIHIHFIVLLYLVEISVFIVFRKVKKIE